MEEVYAFRESIVLMWIAICYLRILQQSIKSYYCDVCMSVDTCVSVVSHILYQRTR